MERLNESERLQLPFRNAFMFPSARVNLLSLVTLLLLYVGQN